MKTKFILMLLISFFAVSINAQKDSGKDITNLVGSQVNMGDLMGKLVKGVKTSSFTDGKTGKNDILGMLSGVGATDYLKYASIAGSLAGSLKGTAFLPDWAGEKDGVLDMLQQAGSIADVAGGVSGLLGNINPASLTKSMKKNMGSVTSALKILSMLK
ncbi:MAG: hypothetical protein WAT71_02335 [Ignavibacteria bacterium]